MANTSETKNYIYLPQDIVSHGAGFSLDAGSSLIKVLYRSKQDFTNGIPNNNQVIKDGLAQMHVTKFDRGSGPAQVIDLIKTKCDLGKAEVPGQKVKVTVTGGGCNVWKNELETALDVELEILVGEDYCASVGLQVLADCMKPQDLVYNIPEEGIARAQEYAKMTFGFYRACGRDPHENFSRLTHLAAPVPEGTKPYLPCLGVICGSGNVVFKLTEHGELVSVDAIWLGGKALLGFAAYNHGKQDMSELVSLLESADGSTCDLRISDTMDSSSNSDYSQMRSDKRIFPFGKLTDPPGPVKKEDLTFSLFSSICENLGQLAHTHALATGVRKVYFLGSLVELELTRVYLTEELAGRNLFRPKNQQIEFHFVKNGGYCGVIGALAEGSKSQKTDRLSAVE